MTNVFRFLKSAPSYPKAIFLNLSYRTKNALLGSILETVLAERHLCQAPDENNPVRKTNQLQQPAHSNCLQILTYRLQRAINT